MGGTNSELFGELESCIALLKMYFGDITRVNTCAGLGASLQEPRNLVLNLELCICELGNEAGACCEGGICTQPGQIYDFDVCTPFVGGLHFVGCD